MTKLGCLRWVLLSVLIIVIDQTVKYWMSHSLMLYQPKIILPFFNFTLMHNKGASFGFLNQAGIFATLLFGVIAIAVSIVIIVWLYRLPNTKRWLACALALILGGAIGNLIDRIIHGYVIDFFDFHLGTWHFAAFNVADSAITAGAIMLLLDVIFNRKANSSEV